MAVESKPIEMGMSCPDFDLPGADGKNHRLSEYANNRVLVIGITCNHCPYVQAYEERLNALVHEMEGEPVSFVCINPNDATAYPEDSFEKMQERAKRLKFRFDYLRDETQEVAKALNAACTPEFYVFDENRKLRYHGRLDDSPKEPENVKEAYLKKAIQQLLIGAPVNPEQTSAIGCSIKWRH